MARRRRSGDRPSEPDEAAGLAGWLYTDLLLGLVVVFLGAIAFVVPALAGGDDGDESVVRPTTPSTTTTTTTTLPPVPTCRALLEAADALEDGITVVVNEGDSDVALAFNFRAAVENRLKAFLEIYNATEADQRGQALELNFDDLEIGLVMGRGGGATDGEGVPRSNRVFERLRGVFPDQLGSTPFRDGWTQKIGRTEVRLELLPYVDGPC